MFKLLKKLRIIDTCPNCKSAWTGGHPNPETLTHCIVCGNKESKITGWVFGTLVDPFCWLGQYYVKRNLRVYKQNKAG